MLGLVALGTLALAGFTGKWGLAPVNGLDPHDHRVTLEHVEAEIDRRWGVAQILTDALEQRLAETGAVLFDVREPEEFEWGHLPGAIRVDPGTSAAAFYQEHGERVRGRPVILYCSVGVRSSQLAERLASAPTSESPSAVFNLRGGVFRWVAEGGDLVAGSGLGRLHPYDADWEKLFVRTFTTK